MRNGPPAEDGDVSRTALDRAIKAWATARGAEWTPASACGLAAGSTPRPSDHSFRLFGLQGGGTPASCSAPRTTSGAAARRWRLGADDGDGSDPCDGSRAFALMEAGRISSTSAIRPRHAVSALDAACRWPRTRSRSLKFQPQADGGFLRPRPMDFGHGHRLGDGRGRAYPELRPTIAAVH